MSSSRLVDPLLEQQNAGISAEVGLRQRRLISGCCGRSVRGLTREEEVVLVLVLGDLEDLGGSWLVWVMVFLLGVGRAEVSGSMANAARARVLTPT